MSKPYTITTAISYPNGRPHIGHAYEAIATDAFARFQRMSGRDVFFQTGTDEHGLKMAQAARGRDVSPQHLADEMSSCFKDMCNTLQTVTKPGFKLHAIRKKYSTEKFAEVAKFRIEPK